ncbi:MAG: CNNM domain-containing protein [Acidimicrobiia bacterium]|nr:CNNM domain-containing protein [Acidimicrobiia bacterium]
MDALDVILLGALACCFVGAAAVAVAEVALIRVRRSRVLVDATAGDRRSRQLLALLDELPVVLNTILLVVLLLQVAAATIGAFLAQRWFGGLGVTLGSILLTVALFVYAEAIPKTMAVRHPYGLARRATPALRLVVGFWRPVVAGLVRLADLQLPGGGATLGALTEEEIRSSAKESAMAGEIDVTDAILVDRSFEFGDRCVGDVMVPRQHIAAVEAGQSVVEVFASAIAFGHRRLPVYRGGLDDVVGVVRLRDVAAAARTSPRSTAAQLMTDVLRCGAGCRIERLLHDMQSTGRWLAIVADDDGRTLGLVTIEDIVAELVGEIADERAVPTAPGSP